MQSTLSVCLIIRKSCAQVHHRQSTMLALIGGATGLYCGYVDFIAWDIREALNMAKEFFEGTDIPWAIFHTFRREAGSVPLKQQDDGTETENQDDELDETLTGMDYIPYTQQDAEAFFAQLEQWNDEDEYTRCIQALNAIPEDWRNYRTAYALARALEKYYRDLLSVKTVSVNNRKPTSEYLTPHTVREIHKLLRSAFNQAVRWELISRNPVLNATLPKEEHKERDIWTAETLSKAMEVCDDPILSLALNLAFSCSLRIGEMLGLTWDCIDIAPQSIENGSAYIFVNKELQRVTRGALDDLSDKGVIKKFPPCIASTHTALVLKEPKTKTSIRRVYLPKTVAYMLVERKKEIDELMDLFGDEYIDNNLVFCSSNGRPMESQVINRAFNKLIKENGLPHVVFHSLRHSSITYKLKLNGGDMKSVQGDSGHAQVKMVADVYSHIIDEDRCINAQRLEEAFYSSKTPDPVEDTEPKTADTAVTESDESDAAKILELLKNPETAALLKQLAKAL